MAYAAPPAYANPASVPAPTTALPPTPRGPVASLTNPTPAAVASPGARIKENDGFGTTAGNPDAGAKYGNRGPMGAPLLAPQQPYEPPQVQAHAQQPQPQPMLPPKPAAQPQTPVAIPNDLLHVLSSFGKLLAQLRASPNPLTGPEERQLKEFEKAEAVLRGALAAGGVSEYVRSKLRDMGAAVDRGDFHEAQNIQIALTSTDWNDNKEWLKGLRHLLVVALRDERHQAAAAAAQQAPHHHGAPPPMPMPPMHGAPTMGGGPPIPGAAAYGPPRGGPPVAPYAPPMGRPY